MDEESEGILKYKLDINQSVPKSLCFDIAEVGSSGCVDLIERDCTTSNGIPILSTLPLGTPPVISHGKDQVQRYLLHPEELPIHDLIQNQRFWPREFNPESLFKAEMMPNMFGIDVERDPKTGEACGFSEVIRTDTSLSAKNSLSFQRPPSSLDDPVKGQTINFPFLPGGMTFSALSQLPEVDDADFAKELCDVPPGFPGPISFDVNEDNETENNEPDGTVDISQILSGEIDLSLMMLEEEVKEVEDAKPNPGHVQNTEDGKTLDEVLVEGALDSKKQLEPQKVNWAIEEKIHEKVVDFHRLVPDMAFKFPFELDNFQKQAIIHLEKHESVYVAAHTSAGKTVVAEYAIALSRKHMTRAIYTSPIKALSNQKFRDFKTTFEDVGLLTGDVQINQKASCLIMTTEILRSMLYNGSDVIRDVEWVIFDEVHYINDAERGVVWEEVLIMLPEHVSVILLSATASNVLKFAEWIGQTKKKNIFVISTQKRPVPLEHFLFTGTNTKTMNELFMIMNGKGEFLEKGLKAAVNAKNERKSKTKDNFGPKGGRFANLKQDRHVWQTAIDMLRKKEHLPAIGFTFSKLRCDENAIMLRHIDLTTNSEKSEIKVFTTKCISRLKGSDRQLPQVLWMQELLLRGFGVHHSGVLPILKEIVEMLFQRGLVKILFATETFAMGVNMPAKTVLFDNMRKHDGTEFRNLLPNEYIQMAGRAGRRGLDSTGMVVLLCKGDPPGAEDLKQMMMGKPKALESQFHLTYSMILNLLRVEQLRVEDMMKRSYSEFDKQKGSWERARELKQLEHKLEQSKPVDCAICCQDLKDYYLAWSEIYQLKDNIMRAILGSQSGQRSLSAGRVVVVSNGRHRNALAVILHYGGLESASSSSNKTTDVLEVTYTVLILCEKNSEISKGSSKDPVFTTKLFYPLGACWQTVEEIKGRDISSITLEFLKIDPTKIIDNHKKRQIPRFRDEPPSQSVTQAAQELTRLLERNADSIATLHPVRDLRIKDMEFVENYQRLDSLIGCIGSFRCLSCPHFIQHFKVVQENAKLQDSCNQLKHLLSEESLELLPEFKKCIEVLRRLKYIDNRNVVLLKGRVACELNSHQLMITELLFQSALTYLHASEIVALLSVFVCEQKKYKMEPKLNDVLLEGKAMIVQTATKIANIQLDCGLDVPVEEYLAQFRFGLVEVVHEWALGTSFTDIVPLTDISEGSVVRCIQRLEEICRDVRNAARVIGDSGLQSKMEEGSSRIKRDIVFAASLYTN